MTVMSSVRDLYSLQHKSTALVDAALLDVAEASLSGDPGRERATLERLTDLLQHTMVLADLLGRRRLLLEADAVRKRNKPTEPKGLVIFEATKVIGREGPLSWEIAASTPIVPRVTFKEAIEDLLKREPRILDLETIAKYPQGTPKYKMVQDLYQRENVFALARSSRDKVTANMQKSISRMLDEGKTVETATGLLRKKAILQEQEGWTRAYAETVYRTNMNNAYTRGIKEMAREPAVAEVIGAFEYNSTLDKSTRSNHRAVDGLIAGTHDPIWNIYTPPLGYNCRCSLRLVDRWELEDKGLLQGGIVTRTPDPLPSNARPDPGFPGLQI